MSDERGWGSDPGSDDWLAEEGRIVWLDEREPEPGTSPAPWQPIGDEAAEPGDPGEISRMDVIRRRRIVALVAIGAFVVVAIAVPVIVLGGGGGDGEKA